MYSKFAVTQSVSGLESTSKRVLKNTEKNAKSAKVPKSSKATPIPTSQPTSEPSSQPSEKKVIRTEVCLQTLTADVYSVSGSTTTVTAADTDTVYTGAREDCATAAGFVFDGVYDDADTQDELDSYVNCSFPTFLEPNDLWDPPIYFINDGNEADFQIVTASDEGVDPAPGSLNDSMYKGAVNCDGVDCGANKVIIKFQDFTMEDLWNVPINQIEYIEYDFYPISCPGGVTQCPGQFYISIYTHYENNGYPLANAFWYNCRYGFTPTTTSLKVGEGNINEWSTFRIEATDTATSIGPVKGTPTNCNTATLLNDVVNNVNLLGSNYLEPTIFILNMGQSNDSDNGLAGYFDNIKIKMINEDVVRIYDL